MHRTILRRISEWWSSEKNKFFGKVTDMYCRESERLNIITMDLEEVLKIPNRYQKYD